MVVFGAGGGSDVSSGDEEEGSQGSAVDIEDMGRSGLLSLIFLILLQFFPF
jgi:hypothetical protein